MTAPILVSIKEAATELGIGRTKTYELIGNGDLETVKIDKRHLVIHTSIGRLVDRLAQQAAA